MVTHLPLTQAAWIQLPDAAPSSFTQAIIPLGLVKCIATSIQRVTAVEDCEYKLTLLRMTLRIGHRGFQPMLVKSFFTFTFTRFTA